MNIFISFQLGEVEVSNFTILVLAFFSSFTFIEPFFDISARYINIAIMNETNAIDKFERRTFSKKEGINIFILPPSKTIGIVPMKIDLNNL